MKIRRPFFVPGLKFQVPSSRFAWPGSPVGMVGMVGIVVMVVFVVMVIMVVMVTDCDSSLVFSFFPFLFLISCSLFLVSYSLFLVSYWILVITACFSSEYSIRLKAFNLTGSSKYISLPLPLLFPCFSIFLRALSGRSFSCNSC